MFQFVVTNILMVSLGVILYVAVRTLPRVDLSDAPAEKRGLWERWIASEIPEKIDATINSFMVKFLRKLKVFLLKVDNSIGTRLKKITPESAPGAGVKPAIDFKEIAEKTSQEKAEGSQSQ